MCGRFTFKGQDWPEVVASLKKPSIKPDFNISPQDSTPVIYLENGQPAITSMRWGLRPSWSKKSTMEPINARIETVESKPSFGTRFRQDDASFLQMVGMNGRQHRGGRFLFTINRLTNLFFQSPGYTNTGSVRTALCILSAY